MLRTLDKARRSRHTARVHVLHGLGGSGKTTVALALARSVARRRATVLWVSAATETELSTGMHHVAIRLGAEPDEVDRAWNGLDSAIELLWRLLARWQRPWLLILDNADNPGLLAGANAPLSAGTGWLRPVRTRFGLIVVTSREGNPRVWGTWCRLHPVLPLASHEAAQVLLDRAGPMAGDERDARVLADRLGGLPLALHLAGSYLIDTAQAPWPGAITSFTSYRAALDDGHLNELLGAPDPNAALAERSRRTITRTWEMSLDLLDRRGSEGARHLLYLLSVLADAPVPYHVLLHPPTLAGHPLFPGSTTEALRGLLGALAYLGLVDLPSTSAADADVLPLLRIHPLVREVGAAYAGPEHFALAATLLYRVADAEGTEGLDKPDHRDLWAALTPHCLHMVRRVPAVAGLSVETIGRVARAATLSSTYLFYRGDQRQADDGNRMVVAICAPILGEDHPLLLAARHTIASITQNRGLFTEARAQYDAILAARRRVLGEEHPQTLTTRHQIAYLLAETGNFAAAERECRATLAAYRRALGESHYRTLISWFLLGRILLWSGQTDAAETELLALTPVQLQASGPEHRRVLWTKTALAEVAYRRGRFDAAERLLREVLVTQVATLGDQHRDVIQTRILIGSIWHSRQRFAEAAREFSSLEERFHAALGDEHPLMLAIRDRLGQALQELGRRTAAADKYQAVLGPRRRILGEDHPDTEAVRRRLASVSDGP